MVGIINLKYKKKVYRYIKVQIDLKTMLSNFLIQDKFLEFDFNTEKNQEKNQEKTLLNKINYLCSTNEYSNELIEQIDDSNYNLFEHEIKYKIFEDLSSISKKNNMIELVLNIPIGDSIISINKIKLSNTLNKYITDIFVCVDGEKIITYKDFLTKMIHNTESSTFTKQISTEKIINCVDSKNITLHILLKNNIINKIINKNIFVNYSFAIFKNKHKYI